MNVFISFESSGRTRVISFPSTLISIFLLNSRVSSPLDPFTVTTLSLLMISTPAGIIITLLPIRDILIFSPVKLSGRLRDEFSRGELRYLGRKRQSENRKHYYETKVSKKIYLFHTDFSPCSISSFTFAMLIVLII